MDILPRLDWERLGMQLEFDQYGLCRSVSGRLECLWKARNRSSNGEMTKQYRSMQESQAAREKGDVRLSAWRLLRKTQRRLESSRHMKAISLSPTKAEGKPRGHINPASPAPSQQRRLQTEELSKASESLVAALTKKPRTSSRNASLTSRLPGSKKTADCTANRYTARRMELDSESAEDQTVLNAINSTVSDGQSGQSQHDDPLAYPQVQYQPLIQEFIEQCQEATTTTTIGRQLGLLWSCIQWLGSEWAKGATEYKNAGDVLVVSAQATYQGLGEGNWQPNRPLLIINSDFSNENCLGV
ncbi:hypothetical protein EJ03DRAFT_331532, partial [Teratosphaeria nubilosa]